MQLKDIGLWLHRGREVAMNLEGKVVAGFPDLLPATQFDMAFYTANQGKK